MSRLWAERLRIGLSPGRVDLARFSWGGRRLLKESSVECERASDKPAWAPALQALDPALAGFASRRDSTAVVLSNTFVRYLVIPWQPDVSGARELAELAALRFRRTFGEHAADWTIRCNAGAYGEAIVACAVETALVTALRERLRAHKLRLTSLQPLLMAAYNDHRKALAPTNAFATIERGRVCLGVMHEGRWSHIVSRRAAADAAGAIGQELAALAPDAAQLDVLLVGEGAEWTDEALRDDASLPSRVLARSGPASRSLALCGAA